jgi:small subunit ribosomal protein S2
MAVISMKALLESGVHFGHRTNKWDPRMKPYIFTERNGIHIIDLQQTAKALNNAYGLIRDVTAEGGTVLFVGTKRQAQETVHDEAVRCGMPYVTERWLGGMLTNWGTMRQRIEEMERLEHQRDSGEINRLTKKEGLLIQREITRLNTRLEGVRSMKRLPELVFVVDVGREDAAVHECNILGIPVIALVDTNCNPDAVDYVIPSNDDAIRAIKLLVAKVADAVLEGRAARKDEEPEFEEAMAAMPSTAPRRAAPAHGEEEKVEETELTDADLLGEATLAKMSATAAQEAAAADAKLASEAAPEAAAPQPEAPAEGGAAQPEAAQEAAAPKQEEAPAGTDAQEAETSVQEQAAQPAAIAEDATPEAEATPAAAPEGEVKETATEVKAAKPRTRKKKEGEG